LQELPRNCLELPGYLGITTLFSENYHLISGITTLLDRITTLFPELGGYFPELPPNGFGGVLQLHGFPAGSELPPYFRITTLFQNYHLIWKFALRICIKNSMAFSNYHLILAITTLFPNHEILPPYFS
jgi:hypothetical protein